MSRVFRIFLSSTFQDWAVEREYLRVHVFPELEGWVENEAKNLGLSARFLPVDLRWGISEEAGKTHATVDICLNEIRRCQEKANRPDEIVKPNFIVFLGQRYGWRPVPPKISQKDWEKLKALGVIDGLFNQCYEEDMNAVPLEWILKAVDADWQKNEKELREKLDDSYLVSQEKWKNAFRMEELAFLIGSVTEQEIVRGAFEAAESEKHVHVFIREIKNPSVGFLSEDEHISPVLLKRLKEDLKSKGYPTHSYTLDTIIDESYLNCFGEDVRAELQSIIGAELKELAELGEKNKVDPPDLGCFVERNELKALVEWDAKEPMMLYGDAGTGKSTLLAKFSEDLNDEKVKTLTYWIGRDSRCASGLGLLKSILEDLREYIPNQEDEPKSLASLNLQELESGIKKALEGLGSKVRILIDAVDQLPASDPVRTLRWLSENAPVLLSSLDETHRDYFQIDQVIELGIMSQEDSNVLLNKWFSHAARKLTDNQQKALFKEYNGTPLQLRVLFERAQKLRSFDDVPTWLNGENQPTENAITDFYDHLAREEEHGRVMVQRVLSYFCSSPNGLSETDLLHLIRHDEYIVASFRQRSPNSPSVEMLPEIIWSRLYHDLECFLSVRNIQGEILLDFYHLQFRRVVGKWAGKETFDDCRKRFTSMMLLEWGNHATEVRQRVLYTLPTLLFQTKNSQLYQLCGNNQFTSALKLLDEILPIEACWKAIELAYHEKHLEALVSSMKNRSQWFEGIDINLIAENYGLEKAMEVVRTICPTEISGVFNFYLLKKYSEQPLLKGPEKLMEKSQYWSFLNYVDKDYFQHNLVDLTADTNIDLLRCLENDINHLEKQESELECFWRPFHAKAILAGQAFKAAQQKNIEKIEPLLKKAVRYPEKPSTKIGLLKKQQLVKAVPYQLLYYCLVALTNRKYKGNDLFNKYIGTKKETLENLASKAESELSQGEASKSLLYLDGLILQSFSDLPFSYEGKESAFVRSVCERISVYKTMKKGLAFLDSKLENSSTLEKDEMILALFMHSCGQESWDINCKKDLKKRERSFHSIAHYQCFWYIVCVHFTSQKNNELMLFALNHWLKPYQIKETRYTELLLASNTVDEEQNFKLDMMPITLKYIQRDYLLGRQDRVEGISSEQEDDCLLNSPMNESELELLNSESSKIDKLLSEGASIHTIQKGHDDVMWHILKTVEYMTENHEGSFALLKKAVGFIEGTSDSDVPLYSNEFGKICMDLNLRELAKVCFEQGKAQHKCYIDLKNGLDDCDKSDAYSSMTNSLFGGALILIKKETQVHEQVKLCKNWLLWSNKQDVKNDEVLFVVDKLWEESDHLVVVQGLFRLQMHPEWLLEHLSVLPSYLFTKPMISLLLKGMPNKEEWHLMLLEKVSSHADLAKVMGKEIAQCLCKMETVNLTV